MLAKSHISLGLLGGIGISYIDGLNDVSGIYMDLLLPIIVIGSVFPDIDEPRSFIGKKLPIISHIVSLSFSHRGFTHFFIFPLLIVICGVLLLLYNQVIAFCCFAFAFGIFIHQVGDMMTISGIPYYFFPFSNVKGVILPRFLRFKTGGMVEKCILCIIFIPLVVFFGMDKLNINVDIKYIFKLIGEFV